MRKQIFLWAGVITLFTLLIFAFANILYVQQYYIFFYSVSMSATIAVLLSGALGFLIGFFAMLYTFEAQKEKASAEELESQGESPAETVDTAPEPVKKEAEAPVTPVDDFDEDDEVLG